MYVGAFQLTGHKKLPQVPPTPYISNTSLIWLACSSDLETRVDSSELKTKAGLHFWKSWLYVTHLGSQGHSTAGIFQEIKLEKLSVTLVLLHTKDLSHKIVSSGSLESDVFIFFFFLLVVNIRREVWLTSG